MSETQKKSGPSKWFSTAKAQCSDTGQALTLICLLLAYFTKRPEYVPAAIIVLLLNMIWPKLFAPAARVWFGFSHILGSVMSKILLSLVFYLVLTPVGLARKLMGKDAMKIKAWKQGQDSVFRVRDHTFSSKDIEQPY